MSRKNYEQFATSEKEGAASQFFVDRENWMYYHPIRKMYLQLFLDRAQAPGKGTLSITPTKSNDLEGFCEKS